MLHYAVVFFVIAIIAAVLGARGVAGLSAQIGYFLVVLAVIFLVVSLVSACDVPVTEAGIVGFAPSPPSTITASSGGLAV